MAYFLSSFFFHLCIYVLIPLVLKYILLFRLNSFFSTFEEKLFPQSFLFYIQGHSYNTYVFFFSVCGFQKHNQTISLKLIIQNLLYLLLVLDIERIQFVFLNAEMKFVTMNQQSRNAGNNQVEWNLLNTINKQATSREKKNPQFFRKRINAPKQKV